MLVGQCMLNMAFEVRMSQMDYFGSFVNQHWLYGDCIVQI